MYQCTSSPHCPPVVRGTSELSALPGSQGQETLVLVLSRYNFVSLIRFERESIDNSTTELALRVLKYVHCTHMRCKTSKRRTPGRTLLVGSLLLLLLCLLLLRLTIVTRLQFLLRLLLLTPFL